MSVLVERVSSTRQHAGLGGCCSPPPCVALLLCRWYASAPPLVAAASEQAAFSNGVELSFKHLAFSLSPLSGGAGGWAKVGSSLQGRRSLGAANGEKGKRALCSFSLRMRFMRDAWGGGGCCWCEAGAGGVQTLDHSFRSGAPSHQVVVVP